MKNLIFLFALLSLVACKKDDEKPESKGADLKIELTGHYIEPISFKGYFSEPHQNSEYFTTATASTTNYVLEKKNFKGDTWVQLGGTGYKANGSVANGSGSGINFTITITYNGKIIKTQSFNECESISLKADLPFVQ